MAKKSSGPTYIYNEPLERFTPGSPAPSAPPTMSPSKPPNMQKSNVLAPETPLTSNPEESGDVTSNVYVQNLDELLGGASDAPTASDIRKPVNTTEPGPNAGNDRPEVH
jgi:hypothetical protein